MKTATVRQLRHNFGGVMAWVEEGESVRISKRGKIIALLFPPGPVAPHRRRKRPDFMARLRRNFGDSMLPGNMVIEDRESRDY